MHEQSTPSLRQWAKQIKREIHALYLALKDPRTPWYAKAIGFVVIGYAISPIDLIPDFIPVLGYLDDVILLPLGLLLFQRLVPAVVLAECKARADQHSSRPRSFAAAVVIASIWVLCILGVVLYAQYWLQQRRVRAE